MKNFSTGRLGRLFSVVIPECFYRGSQPLKNTTRFPNPAGRQSFGNDVRREYVGGFTLIELLVVVLIIGILAAVALPQYQKAVLRSRYAQTQILARNLYDAAQRYYMANGEYAPDLTALDIQLGGTLSANNRSVSFGNYQCTYWVGNENSSDSILCSLISSNLGTRYFLNGRNMGDPVRYCVASSRTAKEQEICKAETGAAPEDNENGLLHYKY